MIWKFGNKNKKTTVEKGIVRINKKLAEIIQYQENVSFSKIEESLQENAEQLSRISRLQYKNGQDALKSATLLQERIDGLAQACAVGNESMKIAAMENKFQTLLSGALQSIDNIDILLHSRQELSVEWKNFLSGTRDSLLESLRKSGIVEINLLGTVFNSFFAEAVETVQLSELENNNGNFFPYEIVSVFKRGFVSEDGRVIRKAQVVTVGERREETNEEVVL